MGYWECNNDFTGHRCEYRSGWSNTTRIVVAASAGECAVVPDVHVKTKC